jgi:hypothetical protein
MTQTKDELEPGTETGTDGSVQGCYDECDGVPSFVIADVSTDDAWLAVPAGAEIAVDSVQ